MTEALLTPVKSRIQLVSRHRSMNLLHGAHASTVKGRSFDFNDLRDYVPGDEVADIEWNASARAGATVVREHLAERRLRVCVAFPSSIGMRALTPTGAPKWRVASVAAGTIGYLALRAGDEVGAVISGAGELSRTAYRTTESHLERLLQQHRAAVGEHEPAGASVALPPPAFDEQLAHIQRAVRHRGCLAVIADSQPLTRSALDRIAELGARHNLIWVEVSDASPFDRVARGASDVYSGWQIDPQLTGNRRLRAAFERNEASRIAGTRHAVEQTGGVFLTLDRTENAVSRILAALEARGRVRK